jgi:aldehyde dehydrogenase (NAD+)
MTAPSASLHPERLTQAPVAEDIRARLERLFAMQQARAPVMARTTAAERRDRLRRLRAAIVLRRQAVYDALRADLARPEAETELSEMHMTLVEIDHTSRRLRRWMRSRRIGWSLTTLGTGARLVYEPRGVVLILSPWNYPFHLALDPLVSALAAGNCAVVKPSEKSPATTALLKELVAAVFDPSEVAVVDGGPDVAAALLELPFDHIHFTGGTAIGKRVMAAAAKHLTSVTLELGGKSPAIVDATADIPAAAERIAVGKFLNAAQTCIAPDYVLVHASCADTFVAALKAALQRFYGADEASRAASRDYGRIVDDGHFMRIRDLFMRSVAAGARIETGGEFDAASRYVAPTILTEVPPDAPVMQEEIFGPLLPVLTWRDPDDALAVIRALDKPLMMYIFSRDRAAADRFVAATSTGGTAINTIGLNYLNHHAPFGGVGASGIGACHGFAGFRAFSHERTVLRQRQPVTLPLFFPPYRGARSRVGQMLLRVIQWLG